MRSQVVSPVLNERIEPRMRIQGALPALLFVFLLFIAGCGGEESSTPEEAGPATTAPAQTTAEATQNAAVTSAPDESTTIAIIDANGERSEVEVEVEIADDEAEQRRGLMERTELAENAGMLFVFDREAPRSFWMRNTLIPLSIAYIAADGRIVDIQDMQPLDETSHPSAEPAQYALEVNQGFFAERGIEVGDLVEIPDLRGSSG